MNNVYQVEILISLWIFTRIASPILSIFTNFSVSFLKLYFVLPVAFMVGDGGNRTIQSAYWYILRVTQTLKFHQNPTIRIIGTCEIMWTVSDEKLFPEIWIDVAYHILCGWRTDVSTFRKLISFLFTWKYLMWWTKPLRRIQKKTTYNDMNIQYSWNYCWTHSIIFHPFSQTVEAIAKNS